MGIPNSKFKGKYNGGHNNACGNIQHTPFAGSSIHVNKQVLSSDSVAKQGVSHSNNMIGLTSDLFDKLVYLLNNTQLCSNPNEGSTKVTLSKPVVNQIMPLQQADNKAAVKVNILFQHFGF